MIADTRRLFARLLRTLEIAVVCDVGSMDGTDALRFRRMLPRATILAFEANPRNFALMAADDELQRHSIHILPLAAGDHDGEEPFFVVEADYAVGQDRFRRGMSSLHRRSDGSRLAEVVPVRTVRLDRFLATDSLSESHLALWIDTEGMAYEVIQGAAGVLASVRMLHIEVETAPIIGARQRLFVDVETALREEGFVLLATDQPPGHLQFNALFVRADVLRARAGAIGCWARVMQVRRALSLGTLRFMPARLRNKLLSLAY